MAGLTALLDRLMTPEVIFFPVRHHSPACAWHLEKLIREASPRAVLIEGPSSFTSLTKLMLDPRTKAPFAVYTSFAPPEEKLPEGLENLAPQSTGEFTPERFAAYYPFCDYSPELVALRVGSAQGAKVTFIDLDYAKQVLSEQKARTEPAAPRVESLLGERHFKRSQYLQALAKRAGCRDHNDLWDHLFETRMAQAGEGAKENVKSTQAFVRDVAAWCYLARADAPPEELAMDGTQAREAAMATAIRKELRKDQKGPVLVVTGGFHTVVLPDLVREKPAKATMEEPAAEGVMTCLVRYSFEQLDALNGYAAGMPSPFYYDQLWRAARNPADARSDLPDGIKPEPFLEVATRFLVELGQLTRTKKMAAALSPADEIAALEQARRLAALRAHPGPTREDLLDGVRSCYVKGAIDAEGEVLLGLARHALTGSAIGEVPAEAGVPPLVEDFRRQAQALRLNISDSIRRKLSLDLYRKTSHRKSSRFLHSLQFLEVPFAQFLAGPDFVRGTGLERLHEHWDYQWTPQTESQLVEASIYGATMEEAATNRLLRAIAELEEQGRGRSAAAGVEILTQACRMGLHRHTSRLAGLIGAQLAEDPSLVSVVAAIGQLLLLWESREPLEAQRLTEIPQLIRAAYERACYLLHNVADTPVEKAMETLESLIKLRELLSVRIDDKAETTFDAALFWSPLESLSSEPRCPALLAGGVAGLRHDAGQLDEGALLSQVTGFLNASTSQAADQVAFLVGLLRTCPELAWRQPAFIEAVERLLDRWDDDEFIKRLPHLRLAFAGLTPRETDRVGAVIAELHGGAQVGRLLKLDVDEADALAAAKVNAVVKKSLRLDGLEEWFEGGERRDKGDERH